VTDWQATQLIGAALTRTFIFGANQERARWAENTAAVLTELEVFCAGLREQHAELTTEHDDRLTGAAALLPPPPWSVPCRGIVPASVGWPRGSRGERSACAGCPKTTTGGGALSPRGPSRVSSIVSSCARTPAISSRSWRGMAVRRAPRWRRSCGASTARLPATDPPRGDLAAPIVPPGWPYAHTRGARYARGTSSLLTPPHSSSFLLSSAPSDGTGGASPCLPPRLWHPRTARGDVCARRRQDKGVGRNRPKPAPRLGITPHQHP